MNLAQYLAETNKRPSSFAAECGVPASTITRLIRGERSPGLALMSTIKAKTDGKVTPDDFMPTTPEQVAS